MQIKNICSIYFKSNNPEQLSNWYNTNFKLGFKENRAFFSFENMENQTEYMQVAIIDKASSIFSNTPNSLIIGYSVNDINIASNKFEKPIKKDEFGEFIVSNDLDGNIFEIRQYPDKFNPIPTNDISICRGIGGVFIKSKDPVKLKQWYAENLGIKPNEMGYIFFPLIDNGNTFGYVWEIFDEKSEYFNPTNKNYMLNFRVSDCLKFRNELKNSGVEVDEKYEEFNYGNFGWAVDIEKTRIELWEAKSFE